MSENKTEVFRKSLNPAWNSEWYRFELDDMELQVWAYLEIVIHEIRETFKNPNHGFVP